MPVTWPSLSPPTAPLRFTLQNPSRSGGVALNGMEQTVASGAERWRAYGAFNVFGKAAMLQFDAFLTEMLGRAGETEVPTFSGRLANWPLELHLGQETGRVLHPGITRRKELDGTVYEDPEVPAASEIIAQTVSSAALGATSITIIISQGSPLVAGQLFGIDDRLYRAYSVTPSGSNLVVSFRPKLRVAVASATTVKLSRPVCLMKLASDDEGRELGTLRGGVVGLEFIEAF